MHLKQVTTSIRNVFYTDTSENISQLEAGSKLLAGILPNITLDGANDSVKVNLLKVSSSRYRSRK